MSSRQNNRLLRAESLENRQLMAGDLAAGHLNPDPVVPTDPLAEAGAMAQEGTITYDGLSRVVTVNASPEDDDLIVHEDTDGSIELTYTSGWTGVVHARRYKPGTVNKVVFYGNDGADFFQNFATVESEANGGSGRDTLIGGSGPDVLKGDDGRDELRGKDGRDQLFGDDGDDDLYGGNGGDFLSGGNGDDLLKAGDGHDRLSGGAGNDELFGGAGMDGMFGGLGIDELDGGTGSDRFLRYYQRILGTNIGLNEDDVLDLSENDATIKFLDSDAQTTTINNVEIDYEEGTWAQSEIEAVDLALAELATTNGTNKFLRTESGNELEFSRVGLGWETRWEFDYRTLEWNDITVQTDTIAFNSSGGSMSFSDPTFADQDTVVQIVFHEIGHEWENENPKWGEFKSLSGWKKSGSDDGKVDSGDGNWLHDAAAGFAREYGKHNPFEDFATLFTKYLMEENGRDYPSTPEGDLDHLDEKLDFIQDFVHET
ncbi:MAG: calcium-binding protein [Planctomycetota bacterium]